MSRRALVAATTRAASTLASATDPVDPVLRAFNGRLAPSVARATRVAGRGRALVITSSSMVPAGSLVFRDAPLIAVPSLEQTGSLCNACFSVLPPALLPGNTRVTCMCGYSYCGPACYDAAQAAGHSAICGHPHALDAWCTDTGYNFPRVAAAMLGRSLAGDGVDFMTYWEAVQQLVTLPVAGSDDELPTHWHHGYGLVKQTVSASMEGDAAQLAAFWAHAFDVRTYARLMGTLRLNSFTIVAPGGGDDGSDGGNGTDREVSGAVTTLGWDSSAKPTPHTHADSTTLASLPPPAAASSSDQSTSSSLSSSSSSSSSSPSCGGGDDGDHGGSGRCGGEDASIASCSSEGACSSSHFKEAGGGTALFATASLLNHDCAPNCEVVMYPTGHVVVRAKTDLTPGVELTTTYVDTTLPVAERRARLLHGYGFSCACSRCAAEEEAVKRW